ncbi:MAG TPA: YfhO family protein [Nitrospinota bacterium]|nr:YfhO family protein [Nitrospinota bacterium]|tara:strand:- start:443 stop:2779 length:2337 start_codon:yes stop_codon:yes gene_type:complete
MKLSDNTRKEILIVFLLLFLTTIYFNNLVFSKKLFLSGDMYNFFYSQRIYAQKVLEGGSFPFWNTEIFFGVPYIDDLQNAVFYPFTMLFYFTSAYFAITATLVIHIFMAGWFLYLLMSRCFHIDRTSSIVSAIIYMFSGYFTVHMGHLNQILSCAWAPLILLVYIKFIEKKKNIFLIMMSFFFGLQFFTGGSQNSFYLIILLFFLSFYLGVSQYISTKDLKQFMQPVLTLSAGIFAGLAFAAVQILPAYQLAGLSERANGITYAVASADSLSPLQFFISIILPNYFGFPGKQQYWGMIIPTEMASYTGILPILFSIYALFKCYKNKYVCFFWIIAIIAVIFAMGKYTPVYNVFYELGFNRFRSPVRFIYIFHLSTAILSGFGLNHLLSENESGTLVSKNSYKFQFRGSTSGAGLIIMLLIAVATVIYFLINYPLDRFQEMSLSITDYKILWYRDAIITLISIASLLLIFSRSVSNRAKKGMVFSIIFFSLLIYRLESEFYSAALTSDTDPKKNKNLIVSYLQDDKSLYRYLRVGTKSLMPNTGIIHNITDAGGYGGGILPLKRYVEFMQKVAFLKGEEFFINFGLLDMLNIKYVVSDLDIKFPGYKKVITEGKTNLYLNSNYLPRSYLVDNAILLKTGGEMLEFFSKGMINPIKELLLEEKAEFQGRENKKKTNSNYLNIKKYSPNLIEIEAGLAKNGFLLLTDSYYPGWKVFIDDAPGKILRANYNFRAVALNKGIHKIKFIYKPLVFYIGLTVSCITLLLLLFSSKFRDPRIRFFS